MSKYKNEDNFINDEYTNEEIGKMIDNSVRLYNYFNLYNFANADVSVSTICTYGNTYCVKLDDAEVIKVSTNPYTNESTYLLKCKTSDMLEGYCKSFNPEGEYNVLHMVMHDIRERKSLLRDMSDQQIKNMTNAAIKMLKIERKKIEILFKNQKISWPKYLNYISKCERLINDLENGLIKKQAEKSKKQFEKHIKSENRKAVVKAKLKNIKENIKKAYSNLKANIQKMDARNREKYVKKHNKDKKEEKEM